ncbi:MAG TPA: hypothetical protein VFA27_04180 [Vicinamibacterales bacterium]|nr:hypothetical protein [Vicinamibacterales bacterium]
MAAARDASDWVTVSLGDASPGDAAPADQDAAFEAASNEARAAVARRDFASAVAALSRFLDTAPDHLGALERLVDVCLAGGLDAELADAQTRMAHVCLEQGCYAEAQVIANDLALRYPDHPEHQKLAARVESIARKSGFGAVAQTQAPLAAAHAPVAPRAPVAPVAPAARAAPPASPAPAPPPPQIDPAFASLRDAVMDSLSARAEARFADAVARLDSHRTSEATHILHVVAAVPALRARAGTRLARVLRDRGATADAMAWLEWVAEAPPDTEDVGHDVAYEIAVTLEALGQYVEALGVYRELLHEVGATYRDVAARVQHLSAPRRPASGRAV